jgi:hypothetical protein
MTANKSANGPTEHLRSLVMAYRRITVIRPAGAPERFAVRVSDAAVAEWLSERGRLRAEGYPDRPPDVDTATMRAWVARPDELSLPYFAERGPALPGLAGPAFPVYAAVWHGRDGLCAKVLLLGLADGGFLCRVTVTDGAGSPEVDEAHRLGPELDPAAVWDEIEAIGTFIDSVPMGWRPDDPLITDYVAFQSFEAAVAEAEADAQAAGLLAPRWVH